jgi:hypothetical protein
MLSPEELSAARKAAAERFYAIGMSHLPEGWTYTFRKNLSGRAFLQSKRIEAPKPVTRKSLYIWLHECAHAHLHLTRGVRHVEEMEAEQWAHAKMREAGVPVPRSMTERAKRYVARKIRQAGPKAKIDPKAKAFAESAKPFKPAKSGSRGPRLLEELFNRRRR